MRGPPRVRISLLTNNQYNTMAPQGLLTHCQLDAPIGVRIGCHLDHYSSSNPLFLILRLNCCAHPFPLPLCSIAIVLHLPFFRCSHFENCPPLLDLPFWKVCYPLHSIFVPLGECPFFGWSLRLHFHSNSFFFFFSLSFCSFASTLNSVIMSYPQPYPQPYPPQPV